MMGRPCQLGMKTCPDDGSCPGNQKCCPNGCGNVCQDPVTVPKPGQCPALAPDVFGTCIEACSTDDSCAGDMKCCSNGCGHVCQAPQKATKPGLCPALIPGMAGICSEMCSSDDSCVGDMKCCSNGCGHSCQKPQPAISKPGKCPAVVPQSSPLIACIPAFPPLCNGDGSCPGDQKCCSTGCGNACQNPVAVVKPGQCPVINYLIAIPCDFPKDSCSGDDSCPGEQKCCSNGCSNICLEPKKVTKPGTCPQTLYPADSMLMPCDPVLSATCQGDGSCPGDQKCCSSRCGNTCQEPEKVTKPGQCPAINYSIAKPCVSFKESCTGDQSCPGVQKCCSIMCGTACQDPQTAITKPGKCPAVVAIFPPRPCDPVFPPLCDGDGSCPGDQKCCSTACGNACRVPEKEVIKPGQCPFINWLVAKPCPSPVDSCSGDQSCPANQKCCSTLCGNACQDPVKAITKPGQCPAVVPVESFPLMPCDPVFPPLCDGDGSCPGDEKCCSTACGNACQQPEKEVIKPGQCPVINYLIARPCLLPVDSCAGDKSCPGKQKCCPNECGYVCLDPFKAITKPGKCPAEAAIFPPRPCDPVFPPLCDGDGSCPGDQKCCSTACGNACRMPDKEVTKPGQCPFINWLVAKPCRLPVDSCSGDQSCPANQKCCSTLCGNACQDPVKEVIKPGQCPVINYLIAKPCASPVDSCMGDQSCPADQKCCSTLCGNACQDPMIVITKPGKCPAVIPFPSFPPMVCDPVFPPLCDGDGSCPGDQKCCSTGCGNACQQPVNEVTKPGKCPKVTPLFELAMIACDPIYPPVCDGDGSCPGDQKCCPSMCDVACKDPVIVTKPGQCSAPNPNMLGICAEMCTGDEACPAGLKCCSNNCGRICQEPQKVTKPGSCPKAVPMIGTACETLQLCYGDEYCPGGQKCCASGCGNICQDPPKVVKPGMCQPARPMGNCLAVNNCTGDETCPGSEKCCSTGCGKTCKQPAKVFFPKAGQCPPVPPGTIGSCADSCKADASCIGNQKCCFNGCGHNCQVPLFIEVLTDPIIIN